MESDEGGNLKGCMICLRIVKRAIFARVLCLAIPEYAFWSSLEIMNTSSSLSGAVAKNILLRGRGDKREGKTCLVSRADI